MASLSNCTISVESHRSDPLRFWGLIEPGLVGERFLTTKSWLQVASEHRELMGEWDHSFHVLGNGQIRLATVTCYKGVAQLFGPSGGPCEILLNPHLSLSDRLKERIYERCLDELVALSRKLHLRMIPVYDDELGVIFRKIYSGYKFFTKSWAYVSKDLSLDDGSSGIRESHKSHINWGRKNLSTLYFDGEGLKQVDVASLKGQLNRFLEKTMEKNGNQLPDWLFEFHLDSVSRCGGELSIFSNQEGYVVGMCVVVDFDNVSYYALAGSQKIGNKNVGPYMLVDAMARAKARSQDHFLIDRPYEMGTIGVLPHALNLHFYKMGFGSTIDRKLVYEVYLLGEPESVM
ncbi:MAG TPA: hypothetical protein VFM33_05135 [Aquabacterium sp.]|nr:hypothetical protein [Aquabacterium sp.]